MLKTGLRYSEIRKMPYWKMNKFVEFYEEELRTYEEHQRETEQQQIEPEINITETTLPSYD